MNSYIDEQGISLYLKDALNQFCQLRRSKPSLKSSPLSPGAYDQSNIAQFLSEYCRSVQYGTHLYKREYEYIMLTTRNRLRLGNLQSSAHYKTCRMLHAVWPPDSGVVQQSI